MRRVLVALLSVLILESLALAQRPKVLAPHKRIPSQVPKAKRRPMRAATTGSMIGGIWMIDANFKSRLYLRNVVETSPVTVTPILHLSNGTQYRLSPVQLEPAGIAVVDINQGLQNFGIAPYAMLSGYVEVQYSWPWNPICATVQDLDPVHSLVFDYDLHGMPSQVPSNSSTLNTVEGLWWKQEPNVTGFVALANTSSRPIQASLQTTDAQSNQIATHQVTISPEGMKMIPIPELQTTSGTVGGVRVTYTGAPGDLIINGGLEDKSTGYSAALPFAEASLPTQAKSQPTIAELGLMSGVADPMMSFPAGTIFTPYSVLRNVSNAPVSVTPALWWMASGSPRSFEASSNHDSSAANRQFGSPIPSESSGLGELQR